MADILEFPWRGPFPRLLPFGELPALDAEPASVADPLQFICANADLADLDGRLVLLIPASPALMDALAALGADGEDLEDDDPAEQGGDEELSLGATHALDQDLAWRATGAWVDDGEDEHDGREPDEDAEAAPPISRSSPA